MTGTGKTTIRDLTIDVQNFENYDYRNKKLHAYTFRYINSCNALDGW